jgi:hypothetical protein
MRERENNRRRIPDENRHNARDYLIRHRKLSDDGTAVTRNESTG